MDKNNNNNNNSINNIHLIELNQYERPTITEERNRDWIGIGDDNNYYQALIDAYMDSTTNNAVINGIVDRIYGKGLEATDSARKPDMYAMMRSLLKKKDMRRVCQDLKLLGEGAFQVTYSGGQIKSITHFPRETLRAEKCNEDGDVEAYYYSADWSKVTRNTTLKRIPVFGSGAEQEIYIVRRYVTGYFYYSPADYQISYATLEKEIADYLINDCQNGFSGTKVVNFNNGVPDREKQLSIKNDVLTKITGSYGEKVIIAFNNDAESKTTIDDVPLNDAPAHYSYLSEECSRKVMVTHRVTSPLLIGLRDGNSGLGSNSEEIINASLLFDNVVIRPYQELLLDCIDEMLAVNNIALDLYFKTIEPLEFMEVEEGMDDANKEKETGIKEEDDGYDDYATLEKLSSKEDYNLNDEDFKSILDELNGEVIDEDWEMVDVRDHSDNNISTEEWANSLIETNLAEAVKSDTPIKNKPNSYSVLDKSYYKVRYKYDVGTAQGSEGESRLFCKEMMNRSRRKVVYRIEDIDAASKNWSAGKYKSLQLPMHKNKPFDLFKFKGGVWCRHKWREVLYKMKTDAALEGKKGSNDLEDYKNVKSIPKTYSPKPRGYKDAKKPPRKMPNHGHYPGVK
jgi:hypothetical protein